MARSSSHGPSESFGFPGEDAAVSLDWCRNLGADMILNHRNNLHEELKATGTESVDIIFCTTRMERHWAAMVECIRPQGHIVLIDDPVDITVFKLKSVTLFWELMYTRSMFGTGLGITSAK